MYAHGNYNLRILESPKQDEKCRKCTLRVKIPIQICKEEQFLPCCFVGNCPLQRHLELNQVELQTTQTHVSNQSIYASILDKGDSDCTTRKNTCNRSRITFSNLQQHWKTTDVWQPNKIRNYVEPNFCTTVDGGLVRERPPTSMKKQLWIT